MHLKSFTLTLSCLFISTSVMAMDLTKETETYRTFINEQMEQLLNHTEKLSDYIQKGNVQQARQIYPLARMYFERSEPIAETFGDLDPRIDARLADLAEDGKDENSWSGFHKIEKKLWVDNSTADLEKTVNILIQDIKTLKAQIPTVEITPELMITGAVDLLNEVSTSKISGEEEIFSKTDLYDFKANIEGAEKIYQIFKSALVQKNPALATEIEQRFNDVNSILEKYNQSPKGYDYLSYDKLSQLDVKALAEAVNKLGEPLAQMGILLEK